MNDRSASRGRRARGGDEGVGKAVRATMAAHRERILKAAEKLFSTRGYHGTSLRDIAEEAQVSLGNIYNHFEDKLRLFETLMDELEARYLAPTEPIPQALAKLEFPDGLETLGEAARETVRKFASYIRLIYVDVIEFEGKHLGRLYGGMKDRFRAIFGEKFAKLERDGAIGDVDPLTAIMLVNITYMHYFTVEHLFGVKKHYGFDDGRLIKEFARVFRNGILKR
ncbi:MAG TPA: TetR family transcriptional regulator [Planctomycetota bacterium]|nr:TetR family transcriptional regulator [Planctomycetota bacterium]